MVKEKKDTKELLNELEQEMVRVEKEKVDLRNDKERIAYLEHLCENIKEAKKQCEDIKFEYGQVTSYLKDIQLIDRAPKEEQEKLLSEIAELKVPLTEVQEDLKKLRDIRYWVRKATPGTEESKEPPKKQPIKEVLQDKADEKKAQRTAPAQAKHRQQDMEL